MIIRFYRWLLAEPQPCASCEALKYQVETLGYQNKQLIDKLLQPERVQEQPNTENFKPIPSRYVPWSVRQQMLESEDRERVKLEKNKETSNDDLEKEVLELADKKNKELENAG